MKKPLPVGISDFKEIILGKFCYVDKTLLVRDVIKFGGKVVLFS